MSVINFGSYVGGSFQAAAFSKDVWDRYKKGELYLAPDGGIFDDGTIESILENYSTDLVQEWKDAIIDERFTDVTKVGEDLLDILSSFADTYEDSDSIEGEVEININGTPYVVVCFHWDFAQRR